MPGNNIPLNSHEINLSTAITFTKSLRKNRLSIINPPYQSKEIIPLNETFNKDAINKLLLTEGVAAIRIYYGMDESYKIHAIMVAVNSNNEDILPSSDAASKQIVIIETGQRCPTICPPDSPLNTD